MRLSSVPYVCEEVEFAFVGDGEAMDSEVDGRFAALTVAAAAAAVDRFCTPFCRRGGDCGTGSDGCCGSRRWSSEVDGAE